MSKWCGDENCLQCADKEPDPYVHLPREEYVALREQNRVLASHLNNLVEWALEVTKDLTVDDDSTLANDLRMIWQAQSALTATSQEGQ